MLESTQKAKPKVVRHQLQALVAITAIAAVLFGASIGIQSADAVFKLPNYKTAVSNPSTSGCTFSGTNFRCVQKSTSGNAETWVKTNQAGSTFAQVYHEMNPNSPGTPSTGFDITQTVDNRLEFRSYLDGKVQIIKNGKTAEVRYGGNIFKWNTATSKYDWNQYFYAAKTTDGTYTLNNIFVYKVNIVTSGKWTMGSLFESYVNGGGFGGGSQASADGYDLDKYFHSNQLEIISYSVF